MNQRLSILVVDDDPGILGAVAEALERDGHTCFRARSLGEALEIAGAHFIEAMVLDMFLGGSTGLEILIRVRRLYAALPAVLMSGQFNDAIRAEAARLDVNCVLGKPLDLEQLRSAIDGLCA